MDQQSTNWDHCLEHAAISDQGLRRANNQDAMTVVVAGSRQKWDQRGHLFMVADGMGAHAAGELAAKLATDTVALTYPKLVDRSPEVMLGDFFAARRQQVDHSSEPTADDLPLSYSTADGDLIHRSAVGPESPQRSAVGRQYVKRTIRARHEHFRCSITIEVSYLEVKGEPAEWCLPQMATVAWVDATKLPLERGVEQLVAFVAVGIPDRDLPGTAVDGDIWRLVGVKRQERNTGYHEEETGVSGCDHVEGFRLDGAELLWLAVLFTADQVDTYLPGTLVIHNLGFGDRGTWNTRDSLAGKPAF